MKLTQAEVDLEVYFTIVNGKTIKEMKTDNSDIKFNNEDIKRSLDKLIERATNAKAEVDLEEL